MTLPAPHCSRPTVDIIAPIPSLGEPNYACRSWPRCSDRTYGNVEQALSLARKAIRPVDLCRPSILRRHSGGQRSPPAACASLETPIGPGQQYAASFNQASNRSRAEPVQTTVTRDRFEASRIATKADSHSNDRGQAPRRRPQGGHGAGLASSPARLAAALVAGQREPRICGLGSWRTSVRLGGADVDHVAHVVGDLGRGRGVLLAAVTVAEYLDRVSRYRLDVLNDSRNTTFPGPSSSLGFGGQPMLVPC
jgi:hypothetical protein